MPYKIQKAGDKFQVIAEEDGKVVGEHDTEQQAKDHLQALYANVPDAGKKSAEAAKVGAMISTANKAKLKAAHDAIRELYPECCKDKEDEGEHEPGESVNPIPGAIDSAGKSAEPSNSKRWYAIPVIDKATDAHTPEINGFVSSGVWRGITPPTFNYIARLHIPQTEEYLKDVVAVKSVDGKDTIRAYSMLWGAPELTDVETEFFTRDTNFWDKQLEGVVRPLTYDHAQEKSTSKDPVIGKVVAYGDDDIGRWMVAQLDRNHRYRKALDELIGKRALGASSDSASQYVVRKSAGKAVWLAQWPWFASALTPTPAEPRMLDIGLPYWKSAGVDMARMGELDSSAADGRLKLPADLRQQAQLLKIKAGVK